LAVYPNGYPYRPLALGGAAKILILLEIDARDEWKLPVW
jgi:hypothetical protein